MTNRGGVKLCHGRYTYTKKATNKSTIRWECAERRNRACKGTIITDLLINTEIRTTDHNHDSDIIQMGANDQGAIDHQGKRPGGKRPGGK